MANMGPYNWAVIATVAICLPLVIFAVSMRLYSKRFISDSLGLDDFTCFVGALCTIVFDGLCLAITTFNYQTDPGQGLKLTVVAGTCYYPAIIIVKLSVFLLYLRLFSPNIRFRWLVYLGIVYNLVGNTVFMVAIPVACSPRDNQGWVQEFQSMDCYKPLQNIAIASSVLNLSSDIYILCLPIPMIWALHLPVRKRVGVLAIFATGSLACAGSLAGLVIRGKYNGNTDFAYYTNLLTITSVIELNLGLICACMPAIAPLLRKLPAPMVNIWYRRFSQSWRHHEKSGMNGSGKEPDVTARTPNSRYLELRPVDNLNSKEALMKKGAGVDVSRNLEEGGKHSNDDDDDNEKGKVGFNRAWYPG